MNPVSIGVIGAGSFGRKHIDTMLPEPGCKLVAIADPIPEATALAATLGVPCLAVRAILEAARTNRAITLNRD